MKLKPVNLISNGVLKRPLLKKNKVFNRKAIQLVMIIGFCGGLVFIFAVTPGSIIKPYKLSASAAKYAIREEKNKFKILQSQNFQLEKLKLDLTKQEIALTQRLNLLSSALTKEHVYSKLLLSVSGLLPQDLWINRFSMNETEILISGSTFNSQLIAEFMNKLEACEDFRNSRFISSEKQIIDSHAIYNFQVTVESRWNQKRLAAGIAEKKADDKK